MLALRCYLRLDLCQYLVASRKILHHKVRSRRQHLRRCLFEEGLLLRNRKLLQVYCVESDHVSRSSQSDRPHSSVETFLYIADGVANLDTGRWWINVE